MSAQAFNILLLLPNLIECLITKLPTEWRLRRHSISYLFGVYIVALELQLMNKVLILNIHINYYILAIQQL